MGVQIMSDHTPANGRPEFDVTDTELERAGVSRRDLLRGLGLVGFSSLGIAACNEVSTEPEPGTDTGNGERLELTMFVFLGGDLGVMPREFVAAWEEDHPNVHISLYEESNQVGYPQMVSRAQTRPDNPLVNFGFFNAQTTEQGILDDMWAPLDYAAMPNAEQILDVFRREDGFGIGMGADQIGLVANVDQIGTPPESWAALWDPAHEGQLAFFGFPWYVVYMAAQLNGGSLDDMEPGWQTWVENAGNIRAIVSSNPEYLNVLASGTAALTSYFNGTAHQWIRDDAPLTYVPPQEGAISVPVYLQMVSGQDENVQEACLEIIDAMLAPEWNGRWAETSIEIAANAEVELSEELAELPAFSDATFENLIHPDYAVVGKNQNDWADRWQREIETQI